MPRRLMGALVTVGLLAAAWAPAAVAQQPPPTGPTPSGPAPTRGAPSGPAAGADELARARYALAGEARLLVALGALSDSNRLAQAVAPVQVEAGLDRAGLGERLEAADGLGAGVWATLRQQGATLSLDVDTTLRQLSDTDMQAAVGGRAISIPGEAYLRALDHLLHSGGGPPAAAGPPDAAAIATELAGMSVPSAEGGGSRTWLWVLAGLVVAVGALAAVVLLRRRQTAAAAPPAPTRPVPSTPSPPLMPRLPAAMSDLLEVSRRLTGAAATGNIDRLVVREALSLVRAGGATLVGHEGGRLVVTAESEPGLLVEDALDDSAIRRVAETGQPVTSVSGTERAVRHLPAALAAVPLISGGRVDNVLVLLRPQSEPFTTAEREVLQALAPVAAAALQNARQTAAAIEDSLIDGLTGVGNRRRFDAELAQALAAPEAEAGPGVALFIADLDHFKRVNDTHGHQAGDALLRAAAGVVRDHIRPGDSVYRYGGEEFCALVREAGAEEAADIAERVRAALESSAVDVGGGVVLRATASFGVAAAPAGSDPTALLARADQALYRAKEAGRNRVEVN